MAATILRVEERLVRTLSRDRAKDMASDYDRADPAQSYAERRGITFRERVAEIVRKVVPEKVRNMFDGLRSPSNVTGPDGRPRPERETPERERSGTEALRRDTEAPERKVAEDPEKEMRRLRTQALVRHARAVDAIFKAQQMGGEATPELVKELQKSRRAFEEVRPYGSHDAEAAYKKNTELAREAAGGRGNRAIRALQLETELRIDPNRRADRFVQRWQELKQTSQHQYQAGDMSGCRATRSAMGDMARGLERDPQMESILANRKRELGISFETGRRLGHELAFAHGIDLGRGRGLGISTRPIHRRLTLTLRRMSKTLLRTFATPALSGLSSRQKQPAGGSAAMREPDRIIRLKTVLAQDRAVPIHHLPQGRRGHVPSRRSGSAQWERLA